MMNSVQYENSFQLEPINYYYSQPQQPQYAQSSSSESYGSDTSGYADFTDSIPNESTNSYYGGIDDSVQVKPFAYYPDNYLSNVGTNFELDSSVQPVHGLQETKCTVVDYGSPVDNKVQFDYQPNLLIKSEPNAVENKQKTMSINELVKMIDMTSGDDKYHLQEKVKHLLMDHMQTNNANNLNLITPPLSPSSESFSIYVNQRSMAKQKTKSTAVVPPSSFKLEQGNLLVTAKYPPGSTAQQEALLENNVVDDEEKKSFNTLPLTVVTASGELETPSSDYAMSTNYTMTSLNQIEPVATLANQSETSHTTALNKPKGKVRKTKQAKVKPEKIKSINKSADGQHYRQSQKRTAHLSAEFRYRTKLNDKINKLRSLVSKQKNNLSKSAVLTRSIEMIVKLQKSTLYLLELNNRLQSKTNNNNNGNNPKIDGNVGTKAWNMDTSTFNNYSNAQADNKLMPLSEFKTLTKAFRTNTGHQTEQQLSTEQPVTEVFSFSQFANN